VDQQGQRGGGYAGAGEGPAFFQGGIPGGVTVAWRGTSLLATALMRAPVIGRPTAAALEVHSK
jgi:hypothetical protein